MNEAKKKNSENMKKNVCVKSIRLCTVDVLGKNAPFATFTIIIYFFIVIVTKFHSEHSYNSKWCKGAEVDQTIIVST